MSTRIITGDAREMLAEFADATFDAIVTDPPYQQTSLEWDRWVDGWPTLARRVLKATGSLWCFGSMRMFMDRRDEFVGWKMAQDVVWEKHNGSSFHADRFRRVHEQAVQFYRDDAPWSDVFKGKVTTPDATARAVRRKTRPTHMGHIENGAYASEDGGPRIMRSVIFVRSEHGRAVHPTQKPIGIVEPLVLNACPPGGLVLDLFAGSGTTGIACERNSRSAVLIEGNPAFAEMARSRIAADAGMFAEAAE